jgi:GNAT superfamily N-acetyltransferase
MATLELRILDDADAAQLEAFLVQHRDTSMFLRSNARRAGLAFAGRRFQATIAGAFRAGQLVGVAAHGWNGMLLLQAPDGMHDLAPYCVDASRRPVRGLTGPAAQVRQCRRALGLAAAPASLEEAEDLYGLDLGCWVMPARLTTEGVTCRAPLESERDILRGWRHDYEIESLGRRPDDQAARAQSDAWLDQQLADEVAWVAVAEGRPVSYSAFNAVLPDIVQLGGVYTPPEQRGRGYAKAAVAHSVSVARERGAERAVLFTRNPNAARSYAAVGFQHVGDYGLVLFA